MSRRKERDKKRGRKETNNHICCESIDVGKWGRSCENEVRWGGRNENNLSEKDSDRGV